MEINHSVVVTPMTKSGEMKFDGQIILTYSITYPHFSSEPFASAVDSMNQYYTKKADAFLFYLQTTLLQSAIQDYENSVKNGFPVHTYEADLTYTLTLNQAQFISLYMDRYEYTGGAHGSTIRTSETWNLKVGTLVPLSAFYPNNPNYIADIEDNIIAQIDADIASGNNYYFDDYAKLVRQTFNPESYYVIPGSLVFYFQQYDIAPYSSGILEFEIPFGVA